MPKENTGLGSMWCMQCISGLNLHGVQLSEISGSLQLPWLWQCVSFFMLLRLCAGAPSHLGSLTWYLGNTGLLFHSPVPPPSGLRVGHRKRFHR